jgi:hypothetical protein
LRIARLRHPFKVGHVLFGNVRLLKQKKTLCDLIRELREEGQ